MGKMSKETRDIVLRWKGDIEQQLSDKEIESGGLKEKQSKLKAEIVYLKVKAMVLEQELNK